MKCLIREEIFPMICSEIRLVSSRAVEKEISSDRVGEPVGFEGLPSRERKVFLGCVGKYNKKVDVT